MAKEVDLVVGFEVGVALSNKSYGCLKPLVGDVVVVSLWLLQGTNWESSNEADPLK